jgi:anti-anti-sigma factor
MSRPEIEKVGGAPVARVDGYIDAANAAAIHDHLGDGLGPDALSLIVDLSDTRFIDSAGIDMLLRLSNRLNHRRARLILVIPDRSPLKRVAAIVGLPMVITIHPSLKEALDDAAEAQADARGRRSDTGRDAGSRAGGGAKHRR